MKRLLLSVLFFLCMASLAVHGKEHLKFEVHQHKYTFSTVFDCEGENGCIGSIEKSLFTIRTNYNLYAQDGRYEANGTCRVLTLGLFYTWATEIDIYDHDGDYLGMIDGQAMTDSLAKFSLYDRHGSRVGIAYLEPEGTSFSIVHPEKEYYHLAHLKRHFVDGAVDHWIVNVHEKKEMDLRILKIFAAFVVDTQNSFKKDL